MVPHSVRERLAGWVADFVEGDAGRGLPGALAEHAYAVLGAWLEAACDRRGIGPDELELDDLREALLGTVARLDLPPAAHAALPAACRDLLAQLEADGRLADGRAWGLALAAQAERYRRATRGEAEDLTRPGAKVGRNAPCPCGSGKKFKQCCMRA